MESIKIINLLQEFRFAVNNAPGSKHLYGPFTEIIDAISTYQSNGDQLSKELAEEIVSTLDLLILESSQGRRPWLGDWELYFDRCLGNAALLLNAFSKFTNYKSFVPKGFCNKLHYIVSFETQLDCLPPNLHRHFMQMSNVASKMYLLLADDQIIISEVLLENPDDEFFTNMITAYAMSGKAYELLQKYADDNEIWVRDLVKHLLNSYY